MKASIKIAVLAAFAVLAFNQSAQAGLLLEPYAGYVSGQSKQLTTANYTGLEYGARVGYTIMGFAVGGEYMGTSFTDDSTVKNTLTSGDLGAFVAYKFPVMVRAYATYVPSSQVTDSFASSTMTLKGNIMKLGVGFTGIPFININLEYISGTYTKAEFLGTEGTLDPNLTTTSYALSISAPFNLF